MHFILQQHTSFISLKFLFYLTPKTRKIDWFGTRNGVNMREAKSDFHGDKSCASTHTSLAKVVGRFTHEPGSVRRGLELRFLSSKLKFEGSGMLQWA